MLLHALMIAVYIKMAIDVVVFYIDDSCEDIYLCW